MDRFYAKLTSVKLELEDLKAALERKQTTHNEMDEAEPEENDDPIISLRCETMDQFNQLEAKLLDNRRYQEKIVRSYIHRDPFLF